MNIQVIGVLTDPMGQFLPNYTIRVTDHTLGTNTEYKTGSDGSYDFNLKDGLYFLEVLNTNEFKLAGDLTIDQGSPNPTTIEELLLYSTPIDIKPIYVPTIKDKILKLLGSQFTKFLIWREQLRDGKASVVDYKETATNESLGQNALRHTVVESCGAGITRTDNAYSDCTESVANSGLELKTDKKFYRENTIIGDTIEHHIDTSEGYKSRIAIGDDWFSAEHNSPFSTEVISVGPDTKYREITSTDAIGAKHTVTLTDTSYAKNDTVGALTRKVSTETGVGTTIEDTAERYSDKTTTSTTKSIRTIEVDEFNIGDELQVVDGKVTINGSLQINKILDKDGNEVKPGKDGDTIFQVSQYSQNTYGPWHDTIQAGDVWKRDNMNVNGVVDPNNWGVAYRFVGEAGTSGDTIVTEYNYSPDGSSNWTAIMKTGDKYRKERIVTNGVAGPWSAPALIAGHDGSTVEVRYQYSVDGVYGWHNTLAPDDKFERRATFVNGTQSSPWSDPLAIGKGDPGINGAAGVAGSDGVSIVWKGDFPSHPSNPQNGWAYKNTTDKRSYVYQSGAWYQMTVDGTDGINGTNGTDGVDATTYYTWVKYANDSHGGGMSEYPTGKEYIGIAYNKITPTESSNPSDYSWALFKGSNGINGTAGADGVTYYTWIKYAMDASGTGMTDNPSGMKYLGIAYNKADKNESTNPVDYSWSLIKGADGTNGLNGTNGIDGATLYTWVKYADDEHGTNMTDDPLNKTYVGFAYNKPTLTESTNPADYAWAKVTGTAGIPGKPGTDGITYYTWMKYADDDKGAGMSDDPAGKAYLGLAYNKTTATESTKPADYTWGLIKGSDGIDGKSTYFHIAYADTITGGGFSQNPAGKEFVGTYVDFSPTDSSDPKQYKWALFKGFDGADGIPGTNGTNGETSYLHIAYADDNKGGGFSQDPNGKVFIGTYTDFIQQDSTDPTKYKWALIKGSDGINGVTYYTWIRYADDDAGSNMSPYPTNKVYIGIAANRATANPSTDPTDYAWAKIKGDQGIPGSQGADGVQYYTWIKYGDDASGTNMSDDPTGKKYMGIATNKTNPAESNDPTQYRWSLIQGADGSGVVWKGEHKNPPTNPEKNWAYRDTDNGRVYIYTGIAWELMTQDGNNGVDGTNGSNGFSVYITYHDSPATQEPSRPTGQGITGGWHTNATNAVVWMSQKISPDSTSGTWGDPIRIAGTDGATGPAGQPGANGKPGSGWYTIISNGGVFPSSAQATADFIRVNGRPPQENDHWFYLDKYPAPSKSEGRRCNSKEGQPVTWSTPALAVNGDMLVDGCISARNIVADSITGNHISSSATILAGSGSWTAGMNGKDNNTGDSAKYNDWRFWSGASNPSQAPFRVDKNGTCYLNALVLGGTIPPQIDNSKIITATPVNQIIDAGFVKPPVDGKPICFPNLNNFQLGSLVYTRPSSDYWGLDYSGITGEMRQIGSKGKFEFDHVFTGFMSVVPGQKYGFSAYIGTQNCKSGVSIYWYDTNGNFLSTVEPTNFNNGEKAGGSSLDGYMRLWCSGVAPANASKAYALIRKYDTYTGREASYMFYVLPTFGVWGGNQTEPVDWVEGVEYPTAAQIDAATTAQVNTAQTTADAASTAANVANSAATAAQAGVNGINGKMYVNQSNVQIKSSNYVQGSTGWAIDDNGNCEFNNGNVRGSLIAGEITTATLRADRIIGDLVSAKKVGVGTAINPSWTNVADLGRVINDMGGFASVSVATPAVRIYVETRNKGDSYPYATLQMRVLRDGIQIAYQSFTTKAAQPFSASNGIRTEVVCTLGNIVDDIANGGQHSYVVQCAFSGDASGGQSGYQMISNGVVGMIFRNGGSWR